MNSMSSAPRHETGEAAPLSPGGDGEARGYFLTAPAAPPVAATPHPPCVRPSHCHNEATHQLSRNEGVLLLVRLYSGAERIHTTAETLRTLQDKDAREVRKTCNAAALD